MRSKNLLMALCVVAAPLLAQTSVAAPVSYTFVTGGNSFATGAMAGYFGPGVSVSGSFDFDAATPVSGATANVAVFDFAITNMVGTVGAFSFSDLAGGTIVTNDGPAAGGDKFVLGCCRDLLGAEPVVPTSVPPYDLHGFSLGGNALTHVYITWSEALGMPDFISNLNQLAEPPTAAGRLTLQFGFAGTINFDGALVTRASVPEPGSIALLGIAIAGFAFTRRRRTAADVGSQR